jgi:hypothetical protein
MTIYKEWLDAKNAEAEAVATRRELEDKMIASFGIKETLEGVETFETTGFKIKITGRMNRKVDSASVQEIAAEHDLTEHLSNLFRWKPEINMAAWNAADASITEPLMAGITTTPGRPSFTITEE